ANGRALVASPGTIMRTVSVGVTALTVTAGLVARRLQPLFSKRRNSYVPAAVGMGANAKVAEATPVAGALMVPLRYRQSKEAQLSAPCRKRPTQSVGLPGPLLTVTVTVPPPFTVVGLIASVGVAIPTVTGGLVAKRVKLSLAKRRNSKVPPVVGLGNLKDAEVNPAPGALL